MTRLIDADELLKSVGSYKRVKYTYEYGEVVTVRDIESMPSIDAVPVRHGKWIFGSTLGHSWMKCSECCVSQDGQTLCFSYCPNCGARMDEEE